MTNRLDLLRRSEKGAPLTDTDHDANATAIENAVNDLVLQNLLTNTGWESWSNSTLENVGGNLATNGGFDSDTTGWTTDQCSVASIAGGQSGNCLEMTRTGWIGQGAKQSLTGLTIGKLYRLVAYVKSGTSGNESCTIAIGDEGGNILYSSSITTSSSWVAMTLTFKATITNHMIMLFKNTSTSGTMLFDSVALYEVTPGCVGADTKGPDEWKKSTDTLLYREYKGDNTKSGSFYGLKMTGGASNGYVSQGSVNPEHVATFAGRPVSLGAWVKCSSANKARLAISDGNNTSYSAYHTGGGTFEWLEVTKDMSTTAGEYMVYLLSGTSTTAYFSQPMLVFGSSIGEGNYSPKPNQVIWLDAFIESSIFNNTSGWSTTGNLPLDIQVDSLGKIGAGAKLIKVLVIVADSASASASGPTGIWLTGKQVAQACYINDITGITNGKNRWLFGEQPLDDTGNLSYNLGASGSGTLSILSFRYLGVEY